jgi:phosphoglycolate phosphatase-like HAD superfamily hydrolase
VSAYEAYRPDLKLIICDFDGVFNLNSMQAYYEVYSLTLKDIGSDLDDNDAKTKIDENWGSSHIEILAALTRNAPEQLNDAIRSYEGFLAEVFPELIKPVLGAPEMLGRMAVRYTFALDTAADPNILFKKVMPKLGIKPELFQGSIITARDLHDKRLAKPDPYTVNKLLKRNGVDASEAIMVGDSGADVLAALQAGVEPVVPLTGNLTADQAREHGVEVIIPTITELEEVVHKVGRAALGERI